MPSATDQLGPSRGRARDAWLACLGLTLTTACTLSGQSFGPVVVSLGVAQPLGARVRGPVAVDAGGTVYASVQDGGPSGSGLILSLAPGANGPTVVHTFTRLDGDGVGPRAGVTLGRDGWLYGATGGNSDVGDFGTIFKVQTNGAGFVTLHRFAGVGGDGALPAAPLVQGTDGTLFGTTSKGGAMNAGTVFQVNPDGTGYASLHSFGAFTNDGVSPVGRLALGSDGAVYGVTSAGGAEGAGAVFTVSPGGSNYSVLTSLPHLAGGAGGPHGGLVQSVNGLLFGSSGANYLFTVSTSGAVLQVVHSFTGSAGATNQPADGSAPAGDLILGGDGRVYGATEAGGAAGNGTLFSLSADGGGYTNLLSFPAGYSGAKELSLGLDAGLYGSFLDETALVGGVFQATGADLVALWRSPWPAAAPPNFIGGLVQGGDGALYTVVSSSSAAPAEALLRVSEDARQASVVLSYPQTHTGLLDADPALVAGADGAVYGLLRTIGTFSHLYRYDPVRGAYTNLAPLGLSTVSGWSPGPDGVLYGAGFGVGGRLFGVNGDGSGFTTLYALPGATGQSAPVVLAGQDGQLYGLGDGALFRLAPDGSGYRLLHSFGLGADGSRLAPRSLTWGGDGALYGGVTSARGGALFRVGLDGASYVPLGAWFANGSLQGFSPSSPLTLGADGFLYGAATAPGATNGAGGLLFRVNRDGAHFLALGDEGAEQSPAPATPVIQGGDGAFYYLRAGGQGIERLSFSNQVTVGATPAVVATNGVPFLYTLPFKTFLNPIPSQPLTYSASWLPAGAVFDPDAHTLAGTIHGVGRAYVLITAVDPTDEARSASVSVPLIVLPAAGSVMTSVIRGFDGRAWVQGLGVPGERYGIEFAPTVAGPWNVVLMAITDPTGGFRIRDRYGDFTQPRFYHAIWAP